MRKVVNAKSKISQGVSLVVGHALAANMEQVRKSKNRALGKLLQSMLSEIPERRPPSCKEVVEEANRILSESIPIPGVPYFGRASFPDYEGDTSDPTRGAEAL